MKNIYFLALLIVTLLVSCKEKITPPTRTELLTDEIWYVFGDNVEECEKDDPLDFRDDGTLVIIFDEGIPCDSLPDRQRLVGFWSFYGESQLILFFPYQLDTFTIHTLSEEKLSIEFNNEVTAMKHL